jgi:hypothetical protein
LHLSTYFGKAVAVFTDTEINLILSY